MDRELGHQGLAGSGRRRDDHRLAVEDGGDGAELEIVERKRVAGLERLEQFLGHGRGTSLARALTVPRPCAAAKPRVGSGAMKLTGKVALITNVTHFMGPAITEEFCREGASVALHARDPALIKPFATIAERLGRDVLALGGDLSRAAEAGPAREAGVARLGAPATLGDTDTRPASGGPG